MNNISALIRLIRPHQLIKNGFVFLPLFFAGKLFEPSAFFTALLVFIVFGMVSSGVYVFNDLRDVAEDREHPRKKHRPIACGDVSPFEAKWLMAALISLGLLLAWVMLGLNVLLVLFGYLLLNILYSLGLKHTAVLDISCIALGFVLRVFSGATACGIYASHWIILMTFLLALYLALAKRYDDLLLVARGDKGRRSLDGYNPEMVSSAMVLMAAVTIICYVMYTVSPDTIAYHGTNKLYLTTFWVVLGVLRYMQLTLVKHKSGSPTLALLQDPPLGLIIAAWLASFWGVKQAATWFSA